MSVSFVSVSLRVQVLFIFLSQREGKNSPTPQDVHIKVQVHRKQMNRCSLIRLNHLTLMNIISFSTPPKWAGLFGLHMITNTSFIISRSCARAATLARREYGGERPEEMLACKHIGVM